MAECPVPVSNISYFVNNAKPWLVKGSRIKGITIPYQLNAAKKKTKIKKEEKNIQLRLEPVYVSYPRLRWSFSSPLPTLVLYKHMVYVYRF